MKYEEVKKLMEAAGFLRRFCDEQIACKYCPFHHKDDKEKCTLNGIPQNYEEWETNFYSKKT